RVPPQRGADLAPVVAREQFEATVDRDRRRPVQDLARAPLVEPVGRGELLGQETRQRGLVAGPSEAARLPETLDQGTGPAGQPGGDPQPWFRRPPGQGK